jgi:UDP-N-acetyl-D-galactosamine dehydrogenase
MSIYTDLLDKKKAISVTGLGYVGLPLALEFAKHFRVIGLDINQDRIAMMKAGQDPSKELDSSAFVDRDITFTSNPDDLIDAHFHVIGVPTDIDEHNVPNLKPLLGATKNIGKILKKGDCVVYESTVYPGCTEEDCLPILEKVSGLKRDEDFSFGYSPERINPGDKKRTLTKILKIVSGSDQNTLELISKIYGTIIEAGVYEAASIKVAEAAKVIENTQRDINIALMNELSMIFDRMDIDTKEVLEAAGTKWNFLKFTPGLVGGHCIGVDPYYLTHKAKELGYMPNMILSGRKTNETIAPYVAKTMVQHLIKAGKNPGSSKVLVMGLTFKENVADIRNTKVVDVIRELQEFHVHVDVMDAWANDEEVQDEYGIELCANSSKDYDAVILAVAHQQYSNMESIDFTNMMSNHPILFDLKSVYNREDMKDLEYWRL